MTDSVWQFITGIVILGLIMMLVRPNSPAATAVKDMGDALASMVQAATGYKYGNTATGNNNTPLSA